MVPFRTYGVDLAYADIRKLLQNLIRGIWNIYSKYQDGFLGFKYEAAMEDVGQRH